MNLPELLLKSLSNTLLKEMSELSIYEIEKKGLAIFFLEQR